LARQQLDRLLRLSRSRNATEEQINQRQAELDIVNAEITTQGIAIGSAERQVARCEIRAPFAGLVTTTPGQVGNYLTPGSPVVSLVDVERVELKSALLESQVAEITANPPVFEFGGRSWPLRIRSIFPVVDEITQTREVRFLFAAGKPPPGAIGRLRWTLAGNTLPATFVVERQGHIGVFTVSVPGRTRVTFLPLANALPGQPVVTELPDDLLIVTDGRFGLQPDQQVLAE
jgi:multidrug efflux pump subunit AcrA (membrane-fusion protein)